MGVADDDPAATSRVPANQTLTLGALLELLCEIPRSVAERGTSMPLISVTRLRVRSWGLVPQFAVESLKSARQAERSAGFLGGRLLRNPNNVFRTMTAWNDEAAMNAFRSAGAHGRVMRKLLTWCDEAAVVHWNQESRELPSWQDSHLRMVKEGRPSKVNHPSPDQTSNRMPAPEPSRIELTLKAPLRK